MTDRIRAATCVTPHHLVGSAVVVIPTFEESENIPVVFAALATLTMPLDICVVDDGGTDDTANAVRRAAETYPARTFLLERTGKYGLGTAYGDGFRWVLANIPTAQVIVQMDADLSHDPAAVPALIAAACEVGACIGSRYVPGGSTPDWKVSRRWLSRSANVYATTILRLRAPAYRVKDSTAGFVAWRRDVLRQLMEHDILGEGYGFQIALKWRAYQLGASLREHSITFRDRRVGQSKLSKRIVLEGLQIPWRLVRASQDRPQQTPIEPPQTGSDIS